MGPIFRPISRLGLTAGAVFCIAAAAVSSLGLARAGAATLSGLVTLTPEGRPAMGVWVRAIRQGDFRTSIFFAGEPSAASMHTIRATVTDPRGEFVLPDLPTGNYEVSVLSDSLPEWLAAEGRSVRAVLVSRRDQTRVELF